MKHKIAILLSIASSGALASTSTEPTFTCSLPPYQFIVTEQGKDWIDQIEIRHGTTRVTHLNVLRDYEGSGVCRYAIWRFNYGGKMHIKTQGCYGEVDVPEASVGEIVIDEPRDYSKSFFCY